MDKKVTSIHITKALSSSMIIDLIDEYPDLEEITCAPSVYKRTSQTYIDALKEVGIDVKKKYNWGAESKSNGAKQISQKLDISLNRVYYLLRKGKANFDNRKRKHDHSEIKRLKREGWSSKEIADKLDMPLRSVYYILNKK